jgi:hypothetical protein
MADTAAVAPVEAPAEVAEVAPAAEAAPNIREEIKAAAPAPKPEPRRFKVKIDGAEMEVDEDEVVRGYQRGAAARKRFEEANKRAEEVEARLKAIKDNPWALVEQAGLNPDELAQQRILALMEREKQQAERATLPEPVRRALQEAEQTKAELARMKAAQEQANKGKLDTEAQGHFQRLNTALPAAMEKAGLPKTPEAARMVVEMMQTQIRAKMAADPAEAARMVADHLYERNFAMLRRCSGTSSRKRRARRPRRGSRTGNSSRRRRPETRP